MKEMLKEVRLDTLPEDEAAFRALLLEQIATPEGSAAMFLLALLLYVRGNPCGRACLDMIRDGDPITDAELRFNFDEIARKNPEIPLSYIKGAAPENGYTIPDGPVTWVFKITQERAIRRKAKTIYVGCSGTGSYRPITLIARPPRFVRKRFGEKREYERDPWFVTDYPSLLLPVRKGCAEEKERF